MWSRTLELSLLAALPKLGWLPKRVWRAEVSRGEGMLHFCCAHEAAELMCNVRVGWLERTA